MVGGLSWGRQYSIGCSRLAIGGHGIQSAVLRDLGILCLHGERQLKYINMVFTVLYIYGLGRYALMA